MRNCLSYQKQLKETKIRKHAEENKNRDLMPNPASIELKLLLSSLSLIELMIKKNKKT